ncbi:hypothetical protein ACF1BS_23930 [Streptomyces sp. NPDC014748]|uniref:hypothetical protein n=1 Tax=Streptomyces sp. NPDC014748 TaxID=3364905 RepID=UPI0036FBDB44
MARDAFGAYGPVRLALGAACAAAALLSLSIRVRPAPSPPSSAADETDEKTHASSAARQ